jgi:hypothetical protein
MPAATSCATVVVRGCGKGADRVEKLCETVMVILMCRRPPARRGLGANAPQVLQRTAELIPNQLKFSAPRRLPPWTASTDPASGANHCSTAVDKCLEGRTVRQPRAGSRARSVRTISNRTTRRRLGRPPLPARGPELLTETFLWQNMRLAMWPIGGPDGHVARHQFLLTLRQVQPLALSTSRHSIEWV